MNGTTLQKRSKHGTFRVMRFLNAHRTLLLGFFLVFSLTLGLVNYVNAEEVPAVSDPVPTTAPAADPVPAPTAEPVSAPAPEVKAPAAGSALISLWQEKQSSFWDFFNCENSVLL